MYRTHPQGIPYLAYLAFSILDALPEGDRSCQMAYFQTKISNLGKFWMVVRWMILVYFVTIWSYLRPFGIFNGYLEYFAVLVCCTKKILATLKGRCRDSEMSAKIGIFPYYWSRIDSLLADVCAGN
jgi:hypothetical protein